MTTSCLAGIALALLSNRGTPDQVPTRFAPPCDFKLESLKDGSSEAVGKSKIVVVPDCKSCSAKSLSEDIERAASQKSSYAVAIIDGVDNAKGYSELDGLRRIKVSSPSNAMPCFGTYTLVEDKATHVWELDQ